MLPPAPLSLALCCPCPRSRNPSSSSRLLAPPPLAGGERACPRDPGGGGVGGGGSDVARERGQEQLPEAGSTVGSSAGQGGRHYVSAGMSTALSSWGVDQGPNRCSSGREYTNEDGLGTHPNRSLRNSTWERTSTWEQGAWEGEGGGPRGRVFSPGVGPSRRGRGRRAKEGCCC